MPVIDLDDVKGGGFDPVPSGVYHLVLTDYDTRETGEDAKYPNEEYYNIEFTCEEGEYEGRKFWINALMPPYTPFVMRWLADAAGVPLTGLDVEKFLDDQIDKLHVNARVKYVKADVKKGYDAKNDIKGIKPYDPAGLSTGSESKASSGFAP